MIQGEFQGSQAQQGRAVAGFESDGATVISLRPFGIPILLAQIALIVKPWERLGIELRGIPIASQRSLVETIGLVDLPQFAKSRGQASARGIVLRHGVRELCL